MRYDMLCKTTSAIFTSFALMVASVLSAVCESPKVWVFSMSLCTHLYLQSRLPLRPRLVLQLMLPLRLQFSLCCRLSVSPQLPLRFVRHWCSPPVLCLRISKLPPRSCKASASSTPCNCSHHVPEVPHVFEGYRSSGAATFWGRSYQGRPSTLGCPKRTNFSDIFWVFFKKNG